VSRALVGASSSCSSPGGFLVAEWATVLVVSVCAERQDGQLFQTKAKAGLMVLCALSYYDSWIFWGEKLLSSQLKEKPLSDEVLEGQQAEAKRYAGDPSRFVLLAFDLEVRTENENHLVLYDHNECSCSCDFFRENRTCSHSIAALLLLKDALLAEVKNDPVLLGN
jgi:SWIM zinc finger